jgi:hypothetical protein
MLAIQNFIQTENCQFLQQNLNPIKSSMHLMMLLDTIEATSKKTALRVDVIKEHLKEMTMTFLVGQSTSVEMKM